MPRSVAWPPRLDHRVAPTGLSKYAWCWWSDAHCPVDPRSGQSGLFRSTPIMCRTAGAQEGRRKTEDGRRKTGQLVINAAGSMPFFGPRLVGAGACIVPPHHGDVHCVLRTNTYLVWYYLVAARRFSSKQTGQPIMTCHKSLFQEAWQFRTSAWVLFRLHASVGMIRLTIY